MSAPKGVHPKLNTVYRRQTFVIEVPGIGAEIGLINPDNYSHVLQLEEQTTVIMLHVLLRVSACYPKRPVRFYVPRNYRSLCCDCGEVTSIYPLMSVRDDIVCYCAIDVPQW